jgi:hypothetical protein
MPRDKGDDPVYRRGDNIRDNLNEALQQLDPQSAKMVEIKLKKLFGPQYL